MREVGTLEARNSLSALIEQVEKGEEITITRHGRPVARLVPASHQTSDIEKPWSGREVLPVGWRVDVASDRHPDGMAGVFQPKLRVSRVLSNLSGVIEGVHASKNIEGRLLPVSTRRFSSRRSKRRGGGHQNRLPEY